MSLTGIFSVIATLRYEFAIMLPKEEKDAANLLALSIIITFFMSLVILLLTFFFNTQIAKLLGNNEVAPWLYLVPLTVFFAGIYQAFNYWSTRKKTFKRNALSRISQTTGMSAVNLSFGLVKAGSVGLILGNVLGQFFAALVLSWNSMIQWKQFKGVVTKEKIKENGRKYINFARINSPQALVDSLQDNGIVFIIVYYFASSLLGLYSFAFRIIKAPAGLICSALFQVFYERASRAHRNNENLQPLVLKMYRNVALIGFPFFLILFLTAPALFSFVFGKEWYISGIIAQIIIPWLFFNFVASPVSSMPIIMNKQKGAMIITFIDISLRIVALVIGGIFNDYKLGFMLMSGSCSIIYIYILFWYYKIAGNKTTDAYAG
jgi:O-antigen/teichoic acid export membrane protein